MVVDSESGVVGDVAADGGAPIAEEASALPRVAYIFTRFPHLTETFLQREIRAMVSLGLRPAVYSFHGGGGEFCGLQVRRISKWNLLRLFWRIPGEWRRHPRELTQLAGRLFLTWPRDWMNYWENLYGAGIAVVVADEFRVRGFEHVHAAWASFPAMAAWVVARLTGVTFSFGAHAYDLFEYGGDWWLREKGLGASFVHTSTRAGRERLLALGFQDTQIALAHRGLDELPECRPLRRPRDPIHLVCVARLVPKKGLLRQMMLYVALRRAGLRFRVRILGDGPLRSRLRAEIDRSGLSDAVELLGEVPHERVWKELAEADVLVHTGEVTPSGDRDGLPNVVPEAMAAGVIAFTVPAAGVLDAVSHERTGIVHPVDAWEDWLRDLERVRDDDAFAGALREHARRWVEENFDARKNAALLLARFCQASRGDSGGSVPLRFDVMDASDAVF